MTDTVRLLLTLLLAGAALTLGAAIWSWWADRERALTRLAGRVLGGAPDALCISPPRNAAVALRVETGKILLLWNGGAGALLYPVLLFAFGGVTPAEARAAFRRRKSDVATPPTDLS